MFGLCSNAATTIETMMITPNTSMFLTEATSVAPVLSCWKSFDEKRQAGFARALAGRYAR
jgi:hypothetical protein